MLHLGCLKEAMIGQQGLKFTVQSIYSKRFPQAHSHPKEATWNQLTKRLSAVELIKDNLLQ